MAHAALKLIPTIVSEASRAFGKKMFEFRRDNRVSLAELADMVDMSVDDLLSIERGRLEISPCKVEMIQRFVPELAS